MDESFLTLLNGLAGLAALVNSLLMWPTIRYLKRLEPRVERLEAVEIRRKKKARRVPRTAGANSKQ